MGYFGLFRLSEAGSLRGLNDLTIGGNLELKPYFLGGLERDESTAFANKKMNDVGFDAKVALTGNLTLDFTVNTNMIVEVKSNGASGTVSTTAHRLIKAKK